MEVMREDGKFYAVTGGGNAVLLYKESGGVMSIYHTFVPENERGKGIAERLAFAAFEFAERNKLKVKPDCPYIVHFLEKHQDLRTLSV